MGPCSSWLGKRGRETLRYCFREIQYVPILVSLGCPQAIPFAGFCRLWRRPELRPLLWRPWFCRSTRGRLAKSRKSSPCSRRLPVHQRGQNEKVSPRFSCLIRNLAPLPLSSVACGLLPKRSAPSSELGASHSCASAPITSGPLRRRTKGPPRPQPWRNSISMKAAQAVSGARAGSQQLSLGGADASNVFHLRRTRTNAARRSAR